MKGKALDFKNWFLKAEESLEMRRTSKKNKKISNERLCIESFYAVEFTLKGLLIYHGIRFPKTHVIATLIDLLEKNGHHLPDELRAIQNLTYFKIETQYPDDYDEVSSADERKNFELAKKTLHWATKIIENKNSLFN